MIKKVISDKNKIIHDYVYEDTAKLIRLFKISVAYKYRDTIFN